ncbi:hypothetical protein FGO68_gene9502 [Halteria grandinella]|uniref:Uncharacterized protein n=1 Tax=Halteria grandinella TaxID=5974 RepID=A0A8J8P1H8_HALGN|nr:hypothetical protein FGO68_gene9502 [Halteria grandinella]
MKVAQIVWQSQSVPSITIQKEVRPEPTKSCIATKISPVAGATVTAFAGPLKLQREQAKTGAIVTGKIFEALKGVIWMELDVSDIIQQNLLVI